MNFIHTIKTSERERGQTLTEFALVLPILLMVLFGIVQLGIAFNHYVTITDAARAGARKAVVSRQASNPTSVTTTAVKASATNLDPSKLGVTVSSTWQQGQDVTVTATYPYQISLLGLVVTSGTITSSTTERLE
jgi:Flp pilus assembly protein TadG